MTDSRKTDTGVAELINELRKGAHANKAPIWKDIAMRLEKPNRSWAEVNVGKLPDVASKGETVIIPGKLLGTGSIDIPLTVAARRRSGTAKAKVEAAGGKVLTVSQLFKANPRGSKVRIIA